VDFLNLHIFPNLQQLGQAAADHVAQFSAEAVAARGRFIVALSGGSLPKILGPALVAAGQMDWSAWHVGWADERCVPPAHPDSNYNVAKAYFFDHVSIPPDQIYNPDTTLDPAATAAAYESTLAQLFFNLPNFQPPFGRNLPSPPPRLPASPPLPRFDLILLGMGEDGHTASLFPGQPLLHETNRWVAPIFDSPKPPPERITLTLPVINNAHHVIFIAAGAGKAEILPRVFAPNSQLPASLVQPIAGDLHWFVDEAAAGQLTRF
jgi:6-phosphogluconolactonase